ncbi:hypothetical protein [Polynucleobacter sp. UB-Tiil-W10]|uniref:hypothetical protein n=1 Tax=Polynucleobacter sp. UB-Tiil-W10 TaxID=1855648 RepID=UPI001C0BD9AF|nr:hypothetical protein [Polynucleobacter sp. UB-Tiil-W10]
MKPFYIDYSQEKIEEHQHAYRCLHCKIPTTIIFGLLENHAKDCSYRIQQSKWTQLEAGLRPHKTHFDEPHIDEVD